MTGTGDGKCRGGSGSDENHGERQMQLCLVAPPLSSCCVAWFLPGGGQVLVMAWGLGTPALGLSLQMITLSANTDCCSSYSSS